MDVFLHAVYVLCLLNYNTCLTSRPMNLTVLCAIVHAGERTYTYTRVISSRIIILQYQRLCCFIVSAEKRKRVRVSEYYMYMPVCRDIV